MSQARREKLQQDLATYKLAITRIHTELNTLADISRLPIELLTLIFQLCAGYRRNSGYFAELSHELISITHVCKRWREVALNTPQLWSTITLSRRTHPDYLLATIQRSKTQLIVVDMNIDDWTEGLDVVWDELPRIQHIRIANAYELPSSPFRAPHLHTLDVITCAVDCSARLIKDLHSIHFVPTLQSISFNYFPGCWEALRLLTGLQHLCLENQIDEGDTSLMDDLPMVDEAVDSLRHLPYLQTFKLHCRFSSNDSVVQTSHKPHPLLSLTKIILTGHPADCATLLHRLSLPALIYADLSQIYPALPDNGNLPAATLPIAVCIADRLKTLGLPLRVSIHKPSARFDHCFQVKTTVSRQGTFTPADAMPATPQLIMPISCFRVLQEDLLARLPLDMIQTVVNGFYPTLHEYSSTDTQLFPIILKGARNIEELEVFGCDCMILSQFFKAGASGPTPYRHLKVLKLAYHSQACRSPWSRMLERVTTRPEKTLPCIQLLDRALQQLVQVSGRKLPRLVIEKWRPSFSWEHQEILRTHAEEVVLTEVDLTRG